MKLLETSRKAVKQAAAAVVAAVTPASEQRTGDPWYRDDERRAAVNAGSGRGRGSWLGPRRPRWLRGGRTR
jgi:hypothetical protein